MAMQTQCKECVLKKKPFSAFVFWSTVRSTQTTPVNKYLHVLIKFPFDTLGFAKSANSASAAVYDTTEVPWIDTSNATKSVRIASGSTQVNRAWHVAVPHAATTATATRNNAATADEFFAAANASTTTTRATWSTYVSTGSRKCQQQPDDVAVAIPTTAAASCSTSCEQYH